MILILIIALFCIAPSLHSTQSEVKKEQDLHTKQNKVPQWPQPITDFQMLGDTDQHVLTQNSLFMTCPNHNDKTHALIEIHKSLTGCDYSYTPLVPEKVILDNKPDSDNPLYNKKITLLATLGKSPLVVVEDEPNRLYTLDNTITTSHQKMFSSPKMNDATEQESLGIIAYKQFNVMNTKQRKEHIYLALALKPHQGIFGDPGSGIGIINYNYTEEKIDPKDRAKALENKAPKRFYFFETVNAQTGESGQNKAACLDITTPAISVENGLASLGEHVTFEWDDSLKRLYLGLHVTTDPNAQAHQGAHALAVARLHNNVLYIDPIISQGSSYKNSLFSAFGPNQQACVHHIKSLYTTTGINYLAIVGGKGTPEQTAKQVLAIPLVNKNNTFDINNYNGGHNPRYLFDCYDNILSDTIHGTLAAKKATPILSWKKHRVSKKFNSRFVEQSIQSQDDMFLDSDQAVVVGGGVPLPNAITSLHVMQDSIYAAIAQDGPSDKGGVFHSQAIFDATGTIAAWTPWQRVGNLFEGISDIRKTAEHYETLFIEAKTNKIVNSHWNTKHKLQQEGTDLSFVVSNLFAHAGGVHQVIDIPCQHPAVGPERVSFLIITGNKKLVLAETAADQEGIFCNYLHDYTTNLVHATNGTLSELKNITLDQKKPAIIEITGGAVDQLGTLCTAAVYTNGTHSWLLVGGSGGLGILADHDGNGWDTATGLRAHFAGLCSNFSIYHLGDFRMVRKVITDQDNIYILTHKQLLRIRLQADDIKNNHIETTVIAQNCQELGMISDFGVSGPLAILATSKGVFANKPYTAVSLQEECEMLWQKIEIPDLHGQAHKLFFLSPTPLQTDFGKKGQVFVLSGSAHEKHSAVHRLFVNNIHEGIKADSVAIVPDYNFEKYSQGMFRFHTFKDLFFTDGLHYLLAQNNQHRKTAFLDLINIWTIRNNQLRNQPFHSISLQTKKAKNVRAITRCCATGMLLVAGDFGLLVHDTQ